MRLRVVLLSGVAVATFLFCTFLAGCSLRQPGSDEADTLTQVSTIDALLEGVFDGVMTFDELERYGDFGIGTFAGLDGEMLAFDGEYFQVTVDGAVHDVPGGLQTPFAAVTFFDSDATHVLPQGLDLAGTQAFLDSRLDTLNTFYAVRIDGTFSSMVTRSVPAQQKPYPTLTEVTAKQKVFELKDVSGTVVGFRCPPYVAGVNVPGYHLHFLSRDRTAGGHVLGLTVLEASVSVDATRDFRMLLPDMDSDFYGADLTPDKLDALEKTEN